MMQPNVKYRMSTTLFIHHTFVQLIVVVVVVVVVVVAIASFVN